MQCDEWSIIFVMSIDLCEGYSDALSFCSDSVGSKTFTCIIQFTNLRLACVFCSLKKTKKKPWASNSAIFFLSSCCLFALAYILIPWPGSDLINLIKCLFPCWQCLITAVCGCNSCRDAGWSLCSMLMLKQT